ncbi:hypothetical protein KC19_1G249800 [Ceratodon purpureus]|uniref:Uncharacterized protein n=1 Tax=Ceratodon purpureus TaxID=3225 RepID=A0A8T0JAU7_CERPU|nr:hypothetical protein KC19_1G249800 [Ceratodon purpureus]
MISRSLVVRVCERLSESGEEDRVLFDVLPISSKRSLLVQGATNVCLRILPFEPASKHACKEAPEGHLLHFIRLCFLDTRELGVVQLGVLQHSYC